MTTPNFPKNFQWQSTQYFTGCVATLSRLAAPTDLLRDATSVDPTSTPEPWILCKVAIFVVFARHPGLWGFQGVDSASPWRDCKKVETNLPFDACALRLFSVRRGSVRRRSSPRGQVQGSRRGDGGRVETCDRRAARPAGGETCSVPPGGGGRGRGGKERGEPSGVGNPWGGRATVTEVRRATSPPGEGKGGKEGVDPWSTCLKLAAVKVRRAVCPGTGRKEREGRSRGGGRGEGDGSYLHFGRFHLGETDAEKQFCVWGEDILWAHGGGPKLWHRGSTSKSTKTTTKQIARFSVRYLVVTEPNFLLSGRAPTGHAFPLGSVPTRDGVLVCTSR